MPLALRPLRYLLVALRTQRRWNQEHLEPVLQPYRKQGEVVDWHKITGYYALAVPAVIGEAFALLRSAPLTNQERSAMTYLGALSPVLDDLYDRQHLSTNAIESLVHHHHAASANTPAEALFCELASKALQQFVPLARAGFDAVKGPLLHAQAESRKQQLAETPREALLEITLNKGGHAFALYVLPLRTAKDPHTPLAHALGAAMQVENDLFDLWKDRQEGVRTACTEATAVHQLRTMYAEACEQVAGVLAAHPAGPCQKAAFAYHINLVLARGLVCLDALDRRARNHAPFNAYTWPREALVVDLDTPLAKWRTLRYASRQLPVCLSPN